MNTPMICPRCKENELSDSKMNALSRRDNKTEICSPCGTAEALEDYSREEKITPTKDIEPDETSLDNALYLLKAQSHKVEILRDELDKTLHDLKHSREHREELNKSLWNAIEYNKRLEEQKEFLKKEVLILNSELSDSDKDKIIDNLKQKFNEKDKDITILEDEIYKIYHDKNRHITALEDEITAIAVKYDLELEDNLFDNIVDNLKQKFNKKEL